MQEFFFWTSCQHGPNAKNIFFGIHCSSASALFLWSQHHKLQRFSLSLLILRHKKNQNHQNLVFGIVIVLHRCWSCTQIVTQPPPFSHARNKSFISFGICIVLCHLMIFRFVKVGVCSKCQVNIEPIWCTKSTTFMDVLGYVMGIYISNLAQSEGLFGCTAHVVQVCLLLSSHGLNSFMKLAMTFEVFSVVAG